MTSSAYEDVDRIEWDNLPARDHSDAWGADALSKFADIMLTYTIARAIEGTGVIANCLHPGNGHKTSQTSFSRLSCNFHGGRSTHFGLPGNLTGGDRHIGIVF